MCLAAWDSAARVYRPAFSPLGQEDAEKSPRVQKQHSFWWALQKRKGDLEDCLAPQVGLEQPRLIQLLARIHHHFAASTGKINSCSGAPMALITSSEIAKIARIGISAVQKQYIFRLWLVILRMRIDQVTHLWLRRGVTAQPLLQLTVCLGLPLVLAHVFRP